MVDYSGRVTEVVASAETTTGTPAIGTQDPFTSNTALYPADILFTSPDLYPNSTPPLPLVFERLRPGESVRATAHFDFAEVTENCRARDALLPELAPGQLVTEVGSEAAAGVYRAPTRAPLRFIAQDILTGEFLDWELPLSSPQITWTLSGPTIIRADITPEQRDVVEGRLEAWATWIHVEENGQILASGIMQPVSIAGETLSVDAVGPAGYPVGIPYLGELSAIGIDPLQVVRLIWQHLQSYRDGNLGVTVSAATSTARLGEAAHQEVDDAGKLVFNTDGTPKMVDAAPYVLAWYADVDCGREIDSLAQATPFDYVERVAWNGDRSAVTHHLELGHPRIGARRNDLRFSEDENIRQAVPLREEPDQYASQVILRGKGEGRDSVRGYAGSPSPRRIRRVGVLTDKTVPDTARANQLAADELRRRQSLQAITEIVVDATHANAPIGSYQCGDDILVQARVAYLGDVALWHRIVSITWAPDEDLVSLELQPSGSFQYGLDA